MERNALLVDLAISTLVDKLADGLQVRSTVGNVGLNQLEHLSGSVGETEEDTVVDLEKTEQLENLAGLGSNVVDTLDTDNKDKLGLGGNVEVTVGLGLATETDLIALLVAVLTDVLISTLEDNSALLALSLLELKLLGSSFSGGLFVGLSLLEESFRDEDLLSGGNRTVMGGTCKMKSILCQFSCNLVNNIGCYKTAIMACTSEKVVIR